MALDHRLREEAMTFRAELTDDEDLVTKINDSVESRAVLVKLPQDKSLTLDGFVQMQEMAVKQNPVSLSLVGRISRWRPLFRSLPSSQQSAD
jgi:hypothetical protein